MWDFSRNVELRGGKSILQWQGKGNQFKTPAEHQAISQRQETAVTKGVWSRVEQGWWENSTQSCLNMRKTAERKVGARGYSTV